jgi:hypothetical protein
MNRLKFILSILAPSVLFAQSRVKPENLDIRAAAGTVPLTDVKLYGNYGQSFFTQIALGSGLTTQMRNINGVPTLELATTAAPVMLPSELTIQATRVSNNTYSVPDSPTLIGRNLKVFYNGLFQTPVVDYLRNGNNQVQFTTILSTDAIVTFIYFGI